MLKSSNKSYICVQSFDVETKSIGATKTETSSTLESHKAEAAKALEVLNEPQLLLDPLYALSLYIYILGLEDLTLLDGMCALVFVVLPCIPAGTSLYSCQYFPVFRTDGRAGGWTGGRTGRRVGGRRRRAGR